MVSAAVNDAQGMNRGGTVKVDPPHHRAARVSLLLSTNYQHTPQLVLVTYRFRKSFR